METTNTNPVENSINSPSPDNDIIQVACRFVGATADLLYIIPPDARYPTISFAPAAIPRPLVLDSDFQPAPEPGTHGTITLYRFLAERFNLIRV